MALFLGIDGGGTKTACVLGDETRILGRGAAGGSNLVRLDEARVRKALNSAIGQACAAAKVGPLQIARTCMGVAGVGRAKIAVKIQALLGQIVGGEIVVVGDMDTTMQSAFGSGPGAIVIAGTGSIAFGRDSQGRTARAGGWGFAISDEGSGHWIGQRAVAAAMRARDQGSGGLLLESVLKAFAVASTDQLVIAANATPPPDFAALLPSVLSAADAGDVLAQRILTQAGEELAQLASTVIAQLFPNTTPVPVAMSGGVFHNSARVRETFTSSLQARYPVVGVRPAVVDPVEGALAIARNDFQR